MIYCNGPDGFSIYFKLYKLIEHKLYMNRHTYVCCLISAFQSLLHLDLCFENSIRILSPLMIRIFFHPFCPTTVSTQGCPNKGILRHQSPSRDTDIRSTRVLNSFNKLATLNCQSLNFYIGAVTRM